MIARGDRDPFWVQRIAAELGAAPAAVVEAGIRRGWVSRPGKPPEPPVFADPFTGPEYLLGNERAGEFLGVSDSTVSRLVAAGKLPVAGTRAVGGEQEHVFALEALRDYRRTAAQSQPNPTGTDWVVGLRQASALAGMSYAKLQRAVAVGQVPCRYGEHGSMWFQKAVLRQIREQKGQEVAA